MKKNMLGSTGLAVSELCIGTLPMGPLQCNVSLEAGAAFLLKAMESGVNFFDSAQMYKSYSYLLKASKQFGKEVIIATKSNAADYKGMDDAIIEALRELDRDYIDIFLLHAARADETVFEKRAGALDALLKAKEKGHIRYIGIATHHAGLVALAAQRPEMDVIFPLINQKGMGILGGGLDDMLKSIDIVRQSGKGMYAMKALAGGTFVSDMLNAIAWVRAIPGMHAVSVGVTTMEELQLQVRIFNDEKIDPASLAGLKSTKLLKIMHLLCTSCGSCIKACPNGALSPTDKLPAVDYTKCVLCGYCTPYCPEFAIRLINKP
jgi:aryl-alcohol dehydrogenase-like predicted oxidoreductase/NAD-dependent dihydropyrimidine dehydrogenase PreA subunit